MEGPCLFLVSRDGPVLGLQTHEITIDWRSSDATFNILSQITFAQELVGNGNIVIARLHYIACMAY